jgi:hypothetical protein
MNGIAAIAPVVTSSCSIGTILPFCAQSVPARAAAVKDGPSLGHRIIGAQRP